jgi:hypothetical protein
VTRGFRRSAPVLDLTEEEVEPDTESAADPAIDARA